MTHLMLQASGELIDVGGCNVADHAILKEGRAITADRIAAYLQKQSVHGVGIEFLRSKAHDFVERTAERKALAVRPLAGHRVEGVGQADDPNRHGHILKKQSVGIARPVAALVMPPYDFWNARPWKLDTTHNLMPHNCVVRHFAEFFGIQRSWFAEQTLVHGDLTDIVQVTGRPKSRNLGGIQVHGFTDGGRVASDAQRVSVNVDVFHVNGGRKSFQRVVVEAVQGRHEAQVFRHALSQGLRERMIVDSEGEVVAEQVERIEFTGIVEAITVATAEGDEANQFTADLQGNNTLEKFGSYISVGAQIKVVGPGIENHRLARRRESMNMAGQQRDHR